MANFWDKLGSAAARVGLVEEVESAAEAPAVAQFAGPHMAANPPPMQPGTVTTTAVTPPPDAGRTAELDLAAKNRLIQAMQNDGAPLVEELSEMLETLTDAIPDEKARYLTALKMLSKKSISSVAVLGDIDKCLGVLDENHRTFESDTEAQLEKRVGSRVKAVEDIDALMKSKNEQIAALQQEVSNLYIKKTEEQSAVVTEQQKIAQVKERFGVVYRAIRSEVESQRGKVSQYGGAV